MVRMPGVFRIRVPKFGMMKEKRVSFGGLPRSLWLRLRVQVRGS